MLDLILKVTDGFTFLQELKAHEQWKNIPVIITSNLGRQEEVDRCLKLGAVDYIIKAYALPKEIVDRVETLLNNNKK